MSRFFSPSCVFIYKCSHSSPHPHIYSMPILGPPWKNASTDTGLCQQEGEGLGCQDDADGGQWRRMSLFPWRVSLWCAGRPPPPPPGPQGPSSPTSQPIWGPGAGVTAAPRATSIPTLGPMTCAARSICAPSASSTTGVPGCCFPGTETHWRTSSTRKQNQGEYLEYHSTDYLFTNYFSSQKGKEIFTTVIKPNITNNETK